MILLRFSGRYSRVPDAPHSREWHETPIGIATSVDPIRLIGVLERDELFSREIGMSMGTSEDEMDVKALIDRWAKAVREGDMARVRADHDSEMLMFDVPSPLLLRGLDEYMATWNRFLTWSDKPVEFDFYDVKVTAGSDVAFATAIGRCAGTDPAGKHENLEFRLTMGLRKIDGQWRILHEHHSLPSE